MKNKVYTLAIIAFTIVLILTRIDIIVFRKAFFHNQYQKLQTHETLNMSTEDLNKATDVLLDYIKGHRDSINVEVEISGQTVEMFNQREKDHMVDVRNLYDTMKTVQISLTVFSALVLMVALGLFDLFNFKQAEKNLKLSLQILVLVMGAIALFAILDFSTFWTTFHELLFTNDLWLLDPATDRMILMFPEPFFNAMVIRVIGSVAVILGLEALLMLAFRVLARPKVKEIQ